MDYQLFDFDIRDRIAWISIQRPESYNALNHAAMQEFYDIANRCSCDPSLRAAVLTGVGDKAFCAGGDVAEFAEDPDGITLLLSQMTTSLHMAISRLARMNAPLIARVNGVAAGAGLSLVAACDLAISVDTAKYTSAYTSIGLTPDGSSSYFLPRIIGTRRTMELYLTNRTLSAAEALDWGLVNQVVTHDELDEAVQQLASKLASGPTMAHGGIKKLLQMSLNDSLDSQMERETRTIIQMSQSKDGEQGVQAFAEKRKPDFSGQ